jgi:hypothetical protein
MTKRTRLAAVAALFALGACAAADAGYVWTKDGVRLTADNPDAYECLRDAQMTGNTWYLGFGAYERTPNQGMFVMCLRSKGWHYGPPRAAG